MSKKLPPYTPYNVPLYKYFDPTSKIDYAKKLSRQVNHSKKEYVSEAPKPLSTSTILNVLKDLKNSDRNKNSTKRSTQSPPRINDVGVQYLSSYMQKQIFPKSDLEKKIIPPGLIKLSKKHLLDHGLKKEIKPVNQISFDMPSLLGGSLQSHFRILGQRSSDPYIELAHDLASADIAKPPPLFAFKSGWTKYMGNVHFPVDCPNESAIIFDTEVCYKISGYPVMAVALGQSAWYGWVSPWLTGESESPNHLIPLTSKKGTGPIFIVGHHIGYDRARIKEEYHIKPSKRFFLDTMSLHIARFGMTSQQRPAWMKIRNKIPTESLSPQELSNDDYIHADDWESINYNSAPGLLKKFFEKERIINHPFNTPAYSWVGKTTTNSLAEVAAFHCGIELDKTLRGVFSTTDIDIVKKFFPALMNYCAKDVLATMAVYQTIFPKFLEIATHPVSFSALRHISSGFLPIDQSWPKYLSNAEDKYNEYTKQIEDVLLGLAKEALLTKDDEKDIWLKQLNWTTKPAKEPVNEKKRTKRGRPSKTKKVESSTKVKSDSTTDLEKDELTVQKNIENSIGINSNEKNELPEWYKSLIPPGQTEPKITVSTRISAILLRLSFLGYPLVWTEKFGFCFRAPSSKKSELIKKTYVPVTVKSIMKSSSIHEDIKEVYNEPDFVFFKLPHVEGPEARCVKPLGKSYIAYFENETLSSQFESARKAIKMNTACSYWLSSRERIIEQFTIWNDEMNMGIVPREDNKFGVIIPQVIPMGTITRRAVEKTWLTASNAKKDRVGSELKSMIRAPDGYRFVGADVDSEELWIASLVGDSQFGFHGSTAIGWMNLEGSKADGTDMHSKTAEILGISRNHAKVFNYGRIYGAGVLYATQLLLQFNPNLTKEEASNIAKKLYQSTKGQRMKIKEFSSTTIWCGGTESVLFNELETLACKKSTCTPVLKCFLTEALRRGNLSRRSDFMTSRVNWIIQSSGVDYLHLLITSMDYLIKTFEIDARLAITVHDEIRYLVKEEDKYRAALALQISNVWTRALFCYELGIEEVPQSVAFFSAIDIDHVLRKEVDLPCITPSNPTPIPPGESLDIEELLKICPSLSKGHSLYRAELLNGLDCNNDIPFKKINFNSGLHYEYLKAQTSLTIENARIAGKKYKELKSKAYLNPNIRAPPRINLQEIL